MILYSRRSGRPTALDLFLPEVFFVDEKVENHMPKDEIDMMLMPLIESL